MSTFADEYLKRRKAAAGNGNIGTPVQNTVQTGTESMDEAEFAAAYLAKREQTLQPERYQAKQKRKVLEQLDQVEKEYDQKWYAWNNAANNGGIVGASQSQNERAIAEFENIQQTRKDLLAQVTEKDRYDWAGVKLTESAMKDKDFAAYAKKGAAVENPKMTDVMTSGFRLGDATKPANKVMYTLQNWDAYEKLKLSNNNPVFGTLDAGAYGLYDLAPYMTADEVNIYNYYLAKDMENGTGKADEYLRFMEETLNARKGAAQARELKGKTALELGYGAIAGLDQFVQGVKNVGSMFSWDPQSNYVPTSSAQVAGSIVREDLKDDSIPYFNLKTGKLEDVKIGGNSVGQMTYDTVQTSANMAPSILLSTAVGLVNPAAGAAVGGITLGASAAGNAYQQKIQEGYTQSEARSYGALVGVSEAVLESALGAVGGAAGKGLKGVLGKVSQTGIQKIDDVLARVAKTAGGKIATNALGEGAEEAIQSILEPYFAHVVAGEKFTFDMEETLYSALLGAVMGAGFGAASPNTYQGNIQKITANEKTVLKAETDARVKAQEEKLGRELTAKEKSDIEKKVRSELEKGYVTTDRIEEILGGESWKKYQEAYDREQSVLKDLEGLYQGEELKRQQQAIRDNSVLAGMREELSRGVSESVKGDRFLHESYLEKGRQTERFTADVSKYKGKQATIVQKAIDSGVLNNTNRSHELVDLIAKIGADKDIDFDFVNNEKLKESGFALDGVTVNGYVGANGIAINISSQKALNSVVGHEITHVLEGTELYDELTEWVKAYANIKEKDGYNNRLKQLISLYQNVEGYKGAEGMAKIHQEAVADLVGDFLFTDPKFLQRLLENRNLFQRLWDEIKYLATVTSGTEEARRLAEVQKAFETVYRSETKNPTRKGEVKYDIINLDTGKSYVKASRQVISGNNVAEWRSQISDFFNRALKNGSIEIETIEGDTLTISKETAKKARSKTATENKVSRELTDEEFLVKLHAEAHIDELAEISRKGKRPPVPDGKNHGFAKDGFTYRTVYFQDFDGSYYKITLSVGENSGISTVYNVGKIKADDIPDGKIISTIGSKADMSSTKLSISNKSEDVNTKFSVSSEENVKAAEEHFGTTYKISEAGYLLTDGKLLDFSGKHEGGPGGYRSVDHRDITDALGEDYGGDSYSGGMIQFMGEGNIRLSPESGGINLSVKPNKAQLSTLDRFITNFRGEVILDIDDANGNTVVSVEYPKRTYSKRIINDIIAYFDNGTIPEPPSSLAQFLSLSKDGKTEDAANGWQIKGVDVLLQQEADKNGLVWENGVPFRKDLLELARKRQSGEFSIAPPVPESAKTEAAKSQAAENIAPPTQAEDNSWKVQKQEQLRKKLKNDQKQYRGMQKMLTEEITALQAQLDQVKDKNSKKAAELRKQIKEREESKKRWKDLHEETNRKTKEEILRLEEEIRNAGQPSTGQVTETATKTQAVESIAPPTPAEQEVEDIVKEADGDEDEVESRLQQKKKNLEWELKEQKRLRKEYQDKKEEQIAAVREKLEKMPNKDTKAARNLKNRILRMEREKANELVEYDDKIRKTQNRITVTEERIAEDHTYQNRLENAYKRIEQIREMEENEATEQYNRERDALLEEVESKSRWISKKATSVKREMLNWEKEKSKASPILRELLASDHDWRELENALADVAAYPTKPYKTTTDAEDTVRAVLQEAYESAYDKNMSKIEKLDASYEAQIKKINAEASERRKKSTIAHKRKESNTKYLLEVAKIVGDTSTWQDKKTGISYKLNTLRRNLEDIVKDADGKADLEKAHKIYDYLQGTYNSNEAQLKRELNELFDKYRALKITKEENVYIQMLGEALQGSGDKVKTNVTKQEAADYYEANKKKIDDAKCRRIIEMAREDYDKAFQRVNEVLREHGMEELKYVQGYFPHLEDAPQRWWQRLLNFQPVKPQTELQKSRAEKAQATKTSVAGRTGMFKPSKKSQSYAKERKGAKTDFNFLKGYEAYMTGALDWIYHIPDIQRRRALENYIRITHAENDLALTKKIKDIQKSDVYNADEEQAALEEVFKTADSKLSNFVNDLMIGTNALAGKKTSSDRSVEEFFNQETANTLKNLSGRVSANMVAGSISSAFTNFIPITQSWGQVSPLYTLKAAKQAVLGSAGSIKTGRIKDGIVEASDFLTNRLRNPDKLQKGFWDKASTAAGALMETFDHVTSQIVWRSKFLQNLAEGMSETEAIKNADEFAEGLMAGRSRGNMPTLFESKNVIAKLATAFQLEVNNQYGYMFKDLPKAAKEKGVLRIAKGYMAMFAGAYLYNALYSMLTGRDAAFDPIGIIEDMINDVEDDDEDLWKDMWGLTENVLQEIPFVGGLLGGGRVPLSSALPYEGNLEAMFEGFQDMSEGDWSDLTNEWLNPLYYMVAPMGGGQLKKSIGGAAMYLNDKEIKGSYTDSGNLRFPVENDFWSVVQAITMGQWSGENAREYFDEGRKPLTQNQMQEFMDSGMSIHDYWEYRDGLADLSKQSEKLDYINGMDIDEQTKRVLKSYLFDEKGYAEENPEKYAFLQKEIGYIEWKELDDDTKEAWTWAYQHQDQYEYMKKNGIMPGDYSVYRIPMLDFKDEENKAYEWGYEYPEKAAVADVFGGGVKEYRNYAKELNDIKADKDEYGYTIAGSTKQKRLAYIAELDLEDGQKYILFKSMYPKDTSLDGEIIDYLLEREDIPYAEKRKILTELGIDLS